MEDNDGTRVVTRGRRCRDPVGRGVLFRGRTRRVRDCHYRQSAGTGRELQHALCILEQRACHRMRVSGRVRGGSRGAGGRDRRGDERHDRRGLAPCGRHRGVIGPALAAPLFAAYIVAQALVVFLLGRMLAAALAASGAASTASTDLAAVATARAAVVSGCTEPALTSSLATPSPCSSVP